MPQYEQISMSEVVSTVKRGRRRGVTNGNGRANDTGDQDLDAKLWLAADKLRGNLDAAEYKHVVLGLIFLKYISDAFVERHAWLLDEAGNPSSEHYVREASERYQVAEDRDEYIVKNIFWVPQEARWRNLQDQAKQPTIGKTIDDAMVAIERDNPRLRGVLPKDYARPALDQRRLGELIDLIGTIKLLEKAEKAEDQEGVGESDRKRRKPRDILGHVYEYFLSQFALAEGKKGGEFYTPHSIVNLLVEMLAPHENARIYDPCCGSGGMFVQSEKFVEEHGGRRDTVSVYGQESNHTTWRMCQMNLAIRAIEAHIAEGDTFHADQHKDLRADYVLANPPFNVSDWGGALLRDDVRWKYGVPPVGNANYAWVQHFIHHLAPTGTAGFVLANGSMLSNQSGEGEIRKSIVEADLVDCMVALPGQLFYTAQIPVCLWFLARDKKNSSFRDRRRQTLFIDARKLGRLIDRTHRELTEEEVARIAATYHAWRGDPGASSYADLPGFCKSATTDEIASHGYVLTPGRYVGAADVEDDAEPFEEKMQRLVATLEEQFAESARLQKTVLSRLCGLGI